MEKTPVARTIETSRMLDIDRSKLKVSDLNSHLSCILCGGYFIDATTITECLHSFCRACIVRYLETSKYCPVCEIQIHRTRPLRFLKPDKILQDIVYKLIPGLYQNEMRKRRELYASQPPEAVKESRDAEDRGEGIEDRFIYTADEIFNLSLEYAHDISGHSEKTNESDNIEPQRRFLRCPAAITVSHLKKFIRLKYNIPEKYQIDLRYQDESLNDEYSLMDIGYIFNWRRNGLLRFFYRFQERPKHAPKVSHITHLTSTVHSDSKPKEKEISASVPLTKPTSSSLHSSQTTTETSKQYSDTSKKHHSEIRTNKLSYTSHLESINLESIQLSTKQSTKTSSDRLIFDKHSKTHSSKNRKSGFRSRKRSKRASKKYRSSSSSKHSVPKLCVNILHGDSRWTGSIKSSSSVAIVPPTKISPSSESKALSSPPPKVPKLTIPLTPKILQAANSLQQQQAEKLHHHQKDQQKSHKHDQQKSPKHRHSHDSEKSLKRQQAQKKLHATVDLIKHQKLQQLDRNKLQEEQKQSIEKQDHKTVPPPMQEPEILKVPLIQEQVKEEKKVEKKEETTVEPSQQEEPPVQPVEEQKQEIPESKQECPLVEKPKAMDLDDDKSDVDSDLFEGGPLVIAESVEDLVESKEQKDDDDIKEDDLKKSDKQEEEIDVESCEVDSGRGSDTSCRTGDEDIGSPGSSTTVRTPDLEKSSPFLIPSPSSTTSLPSPVSNSASPNYGANSVCNSLALPSIALTATKSITSDSTTLSNPPPNIKKDEHGALDLSTCPRKRGHDRLPLPRSRQVANPPILDKHRQTTPCLPLPNQFKILPSMLPHSSIYKKNTPEFCRGNFRCKGSTLTVFNPDPSSNRPKIVIRSIETPRDGHTRHHHHHSHHHGHHHHHQQQQQQQKFTS